MVFWVLFVLVVGWFGIEDVEVVVVVGEVVEIWCEFGECMGDC